MWQCSPFCTKGNACFVTLDKQNKETRLLHTRPAWSCLNSSRLDERTSAFHVPPAEPLSAQPPWSPQQPQVVVVLSACIAMKQIGVVVRGIQDCACSQGAVRLQDISRPLLAPTLPSAVAGEFGAVPMAGTSSRVRSCDGSDGEAAH
eukprot:987569-Pleurochrysis_carterae.AAC.3